MPNTHKKSFLVAALVSLPLLASCTPKELVRDLTPTFQFPSLNNLYDYVLLESKTNSQIDVPDLAQQLAKTDVIFVGELHTHQASHLLQLQLLEALYKQNPKLIITLEQFSRQHQNVLDDYLQGRIGEQSLIKEADAWKNYKGSYRPILEFAREHQIPVLAANAPSMFVRCVGRQGPEVLEKLNSEQSGWVAQALDLDNPKYKKKFMSLMQHSGRSHGLEKEEQEKRQHKTYAAQLLRDSTMAETIANAKKIYPDYQVVHLNGAFHSDNHLGAVGILNDLMANLTIKVLSPVSVADSNNPKASKKELQQGDYVYLIKHLPSRYIDPEKMNESIRELIKKRKKERCEL